MECLSPRLRASRGLTLIELISTLGVALVVLGLAVPGMRAFIEGNEVTASVNQLVTHLHLARSEAVKRNARATLCPSLDSANCSGDFDWTHGTVLYLDRNADGVRQPAEPLLRHLPGPGPGTRILTSSGRRKIVYEPDGSVLGGSNATFRICSATTAERNRAVIVSLPGRPRVSREMADGSLISCE